MRKTILLTFAILSFVTFKAQAQSVSCKFNVFKNWTQAETRWNGECKNGYATGLGVLKLFIDGEVKEIFYGRLSNKGIPELGVIEVPGGFIAGRFRNGKNVDEDMNGIVKGFTEAKNAASLISEKFRKSGNTASAEYYEKKAIELSNQPGE